jgi:flagellar biosynthetic protein FliR
MTINLTFLPSLAAAFMLMFARLGTMVMLMPGLGEQGIPMRVRLVIAIMLTLVMMPLHQAAYTSVDLSSFAPVIGLLIKEVIIGVVLGMAGRLTISALQVAGVVVAQQLGIGFASTVDPSQHEQTAIVSSFLTMLGVALIFATDLHHLVIGALEQSYRIFTPGAPLPAGDFAQLILITTAGAFRVGAQIAAPFLVFGLLFNVGLGVLARLMPQVQIFFLGIPASIMLGFLLLSLILAAVMAVFLGYVGSMLGDLALR